MSAIPTGRLFLYIAAGLLVLVVGTLGLVLTRDGVGAVAEGLIIETGDPAGKGAGAAMSGVPGSRARGLTGMAPAPSASATSTTQPRLIYVQVAGAVRSPGVYEVAADARVFQAVLKAGGFTDEADQQAVALAAALSDGCRVYVPRVGEAVDGSVQVPTQSSAGISGVSPDGDAGGAAGPVSINTATAGQLDTLPGIGPALAQQIISYRETRGPFTSVEQLADVPGIGPAKLEQLRPLVGL